MIILPIVMLLASITIISYKEPKVPQKTSKEIVEKRRIVREFR